MKSTDSAESIDGFSPGKYLLNFAVPHRLAPLALPVISVYVSVLFMVYFFLQYIYCHRLKIIADMKAECIAAGSLNKITSTGLRALKVHI